MASAFVSNVDNVAPGAGDGDLVVTYLCTFTGGDVRGGTGPDQTFVTVTVAPGDTAQTIRSKLSSAVAAEAKRVGYTLAASAMVLPSYTRG